MHSNNYCIQMLFFKNFPSTAVILDNSCRDYYANAKGYFSTKKENTMIYVKLN